MIVPSISSVAFAMLGVLVLSGCSDDAPPPLPESMVRAPFDALIKASGREYSSCRDEVVSLGLGAVPVLRRIAEDAGAWEERIAAAICLERIEKPRRVQGFLRSKRRPVRHERGWLEEFEAYGEELARRGRRTPMVIVERLWRRHNFSANPAFPSRIAPIAFALLALDERRALPVLEEALQARGDRECDPMDREVIARVLAEFGASESAAALVTSINTDEDITVQREAAIALLECLRNAPPDVRAKYADQVEAPRFKEDVRKALKESAKPGTEDGR